MGYLGVGLAALCAFAVSGTASAKDTLTLKPTSNWIVDYKIDRCTIVRQFGDGEDKIILRIAQSVPETSLELLLFGQDARLPVNRYSSSDRTFPLTVNFGSDTGLSTEIDVRQGATDESRAIIGLSLSFQPEPDGKAATHPDRGFVSEDQIPALAEMDRIEFGGSITKNLNLMTGPMDKVFKVLDDCSYNLMESIGLDAEANRQRLSGPVADLDTFGVAARAIQQDYPVKALRDRRSAILRLRFIVEEDGSIGDCAIIGTTDPEGFGQGLCAHFRELARFSPAIGADGQPLRSWFVQTIQYYVR